MKLIKRNGIYVLDYLDQSGTRRRISTGTRNKAEAELKAPLLLTGGDPNGNWTLNKALDHTLEFVWCNSKSFHKFASLVRLIKPDLGSLLVTDVTYERLNLWSSKLKKQGLKPATINRRLAAIRRALVEASRQGKLLAIPQIPKQAENNKKFRWLTVKEEELLLWGCHVLGIRDAMLLRECIMFLIDTGARVGEMMKIIPTDISDQGVLFRDTKGAADSYRARTVPLTNRARQAARIISKLNFTGSMFTTHQLFSRFDRAKEEVQLTDINRHTLRHTCASRLVQRGADIYRVKQWLGHSNVLVTERYAHLADSGMSDLADLLE